MAEPIKKILVTGANGFIGKNLISVLQRREGVEIFPADVETTEEEWDKYCKECDFVMHLAGVNRPKEVSEFMEGNFGLTTKLLALLKKHKNLAPVLLTSSVQAVLDNDYGKSKKAGEDYLLQYGKETGAKTYIYRLPNVFGKWGRPNYNSAVITFCYNISRNLPITVNNRETVLTLVYIDDVAESFVKCLDGDCTRDEEGFCRVPVTHSASLGQIVDLLFSFRESRKNLSVCDMNDGFQKKLYSTYLSYLPEDDFSYDLNMHCDARGSFTEFLRTDGQGQVSVNISRPHIVKGNHWHHTKNEKFLVVKGKGVIRFRKIGEKQVYEYFVCGEKLQVVDIPCGYTHNIENIGEEDMVTVMWANEPFDAQKPDTFYEEV